LAKRKFPAASRMVMASGMDPTTFSQNVSETAVALLRSFT
jgi:hypothetical protein